MSARNKATIRRSHAQVFAALGDETRLKLVSKLCEESPQSITQLTENTELTRQSITRHLKVLEEVGVVYSIYKGRENLFEFAPKPLIEIQTYLNEVSGQWDQALLRLKNFVEE